MIDQLLYLNFRGNTQHIQYNRHPSNVEIHLPFSSQFGIARGIKV